MKKMLVPMVVAAVAAGCATEGKKDCAYKD